MHHFLFLPLLLLNLRGSLIGSWSMFVHLVGRFMLVCFQGADSDAEQLSLTEQLFDAALGELSVVSRGQPCLLVGDFNVEPTKIPCLAKGISAGLWVDLGRGLGLGRWFRACCYL